MAEHNLIQAPEILRRLALRLGLVQQHIAPTLNEGVQAVLLLDDLTRAKEFQPQETFVASAIVDGGGVPNPLLNAAALITNSYRERALRIRYFSLTMFDVPSAEMVGAYVGVTVRPFNTAFNLQNINESMRGINYQGDNGQVVFSPQAVPPWPVPPVRQRSGVSLDGGTGSTNVTNLGGDHRFPFDRVAYDAGAAGIARMPTAGWNWEDSGPLVRPGFQVFFNIPSSAAMPTPLGFCTVSWKEENYDKTQQQVV